ncbi:3966_t:CDS:2 [Funneliformis caledonium]|uniref:3966_t:CDS:1 n=1 Tax=Funneliformis caledonium TaxID=1117310 RepID=A0A9N9ES94_9GLOM|nr:3966_t:CDS:2 [Funneliformis caledonium]
MYFTKEWENLKRLHIEFHDNSLNLAIPNFCPNLKSLYTIILKQEAETLKSILRGCKRLERIQLYVKSDISPENLDEKNLSVLQKYFDLGIVENFQDDEMFDYEGRDVTFRYRLRRSIHSISDYH